MEKQERIAVGDAGVGACIKRVQLYGLGEHPPRQLIVRFRVPVQELSAPQIISIRFDAVGRRLPDGLFLLWQQLDLQLLHDGMGDVVLDGEDVG